MDKVLLFITLLVEAITVLECMQIVFMQRIKLDKFIVGFVFADVLIYFLINMDIMPAIGIIGVYLFARWLCYFKFKRSIIETVVRFLVSCGLVAGIESVSIFIIYIYSNIDNEIYYSVLSSIIGLLVVYLIRIICYVWDKYIKRNGIVWKSGIILFYGLLIVGVFIDYHNSDSTVNLYILLLSIFLVCVFLYVNKLEQAQNEISRKNYELEVQKIYGETYEHLLGEVRKRQHDYKNQLAAIYGMHLTARTLDELINLQKKYGDELKKDNKFDSILTCCNNPILAGFIYYKCVSCENENIVVDYIIHIEQAVCSFAIHEIIEILGILIDNACECVKMNNSLERRIQLELQEEASKLVFLVSNPAQYIAFSEIDKMFISGYSSKGINRGIGLARVKELVDKYDAKINVFNSNPCGKENKICFLIEIEK